MLKVKAIMKTLLFGTILFDIFDNGAFIGGCPTNVGSHLALLGSEAVLVSQVGTDSLGDRALEILGSNGVNTDFVARDAHHPTGTVRVIVDSNGMPDYEIERNVAYDFIKLSEEDTGRLKEMNFDAIYFGSLDQRGEVSRLSLDMVLKNTSFSIRFYDVNLREGNYSEKIVGNSISNCNILKVNDDELDMLACMFHYKLKDAVNELFRNFPELNIILETLGAKGVKVYTREGGQQGGQHIEGVSVSVVDTVGAGDAFSAAFLHVYAGTGDMYLAAKAGNELGAYVASRRGAVPAERYTKIK